MAELQTFDLVVIGGGPAGYVGAIRAAQLGMNVACVERDRLGGVCLNWGCIPTKALLAGAEFYSKLNHDAADWGITAENVSHNWEKVIGRSRGVADQLNKGVGFLFKKNKITHVQGHAFIRDAPGKGGESAFSGQTASAGSLQRSTSGEGERTVEVYEPDDVDHAGKVKQTLKAKKILIATGAVPRSLPDVEFDGDRIIAAKDAMTLPEQPEKLLIIGAGAIGMEFAYFYNAFGTKVSVVEMLDRVLHVEDEEVSKEIRKSFKKQGVTIHTGHKTRSIEKTKAGVKAVIVPVEDPQPDHAPPPSEKSYGGGGAESASSSKASRAVSDGEQIIEADKVLLAVGVRGRYDGLFDESLGVELYKDHIKVDQRARGATYETSAPGVYAVGDVIGPPWLAHVASEEAVVCVERMAGGEAGGGGAEHAPDIDYDAVPGCTYCHPQVASIGLTEARCREEGIEYDVGQFPFQASGKAQALGETVGFAKIITGKAHGEVLGAHLVGDNVTELIAEMGLARRLEATAEEIIATIHAHPTLSEAVHEAALGTQDRMIHF